MTLKELHEAIEIMRKYDGDDAIEADRAVTLFALTTTPESLKEKDSLALESLGWIWDDLHGAWCHNV